MSEFFGKDAFAEKLSDVQTAIDSVELAFNELARVVYSVRDSRAVTGYRLSARSRHEITVMQQVVKNAATMTHFNNEQIVDVIRGIFDADFCDDETAIN